MNIFVDDKANVVHLKKIIVDRVEKVNKADPKAFLFSF